MDRRDTLPLMHDTKPLSLQSVQLTTCVQISLLPSFRYCLQPYRDAPGRISIYTTKDMLSNASQTTTASGLSVWISSLH